MTTCGPLQIQWQYCSSPPPQNSIGCRMLSFSRHPHQPLLILTKDIPERMPRDVLGCICLHMALRVTLRPPAERNTEHKAIQLTWNKADDHFKLIAFCARAF